MPETVHMVWDIYDGVRSGIADHAGQPHYFNCIFDDEAQEYSQNFELTAIDKETLNLAQEQWNIYRAWELKFHSGIVKLDTHPGHGGIDQRYDELEDEVQESIRRGQPSKVLEGEFFPIEESWWVWRCWDGEL